ncbi:hypothetical protein Ancab_003026 [Ancistrocladus abbreviatus]
MATNHKNPPPLSLNAEELAHTSVKSKERAHLSYADSVRANLHHVSTTAAMQSKTTMGHSPLEGHTCYVSVEQVEYYELLRVNSFFCFSPHAPAICQGLNREDLWKDVLRVGKEWDQLDSVCDITGTSQIWR